MHPCMYAIWFSPRNLGTDTVMVISMYKLLLNFEFLVSNIYCIFGLFMYGLLSDHIR